MSLLIFATATFCCNIGVAAVHFPAYAVFLSNVLSDSLDILLEMTIKYHKDNNQFITVS